MGLTSPDVYHTYHAIVVSSCIWVSHRPTLINKEQSQHIYGSRTNIPFCNTPTMTNGRSVVDSHIQIMWAPASIFIWTLCVNFIRKPVSIYFRHGIPFHLGSVIGCIWIMYSVSFGCHYPFHFDNDLCFISKSVSKIFGYPRPTYLDAGVLNIWEPASN